MSDDLGPAPRERTARSPYRAKDGTVYHRLVRSDGVWWTADGGATFVRSIREPIAGGRYEFVKPEPEAPVRDEVIKELRNTEVQVDHGSLDHASIVRQLTDEFRFATMRDTGEMFVYEGGVYRPGADAVVGQRVEALFRDTGKSAKRHVVNEVAHAIRRRTYRDRKDFNPPGKLCLRNGALDTDTLTVEPHSPEIPFTVQLPVAYDPAATCPRFEAFLREVLSDADSRKTVQMMFGYCLESGQRLQKSFMFVGGGDNGKSTCLGVLKDVIGLDNASTETLQSLSENRFASANLWGKLANICADLPSNPIRYTGVFKMATGGDPMRGENKFQQTFSFVNSAKLLFACNELPEVSDRTKAFWRRWIVVKFPVDFTGREDARLPEALRTELPGILNWMLAGLRVLREEGRFPRSTGTDSIMAEWRRRADSLFWFVSERVRKDRTAWVPKPDFYEAYVAFCDENDARPKTAEQVGKELVNHIPSVRTEKKRIDGPQVRGWGGIALIDAPVEESAQPVQTSLSATGGETGETGETGTSYLRENKAGGGH